MRVVEAAQAAGERPPHLGRYANHFRAHSGRQPHCACARSCGNDGGMMKASVIFAALVLLSGTGAAVAENLGEFRLGPRGGPGEIRIQPGTLIGDQPTDRLISENSFGLGATLEYRAPFGLIVEAGLFGTGTTDWFDEKDYTFSEYFGSVGYEIPLGHGFTVTPR